MKLETHFIDINCDLGEGIGNEAALMPYISSCNLACGAHAGDVETINRVVALAKKHKVGVGAHPSFPDRANFGRTIMPISFEELGISLRKQIDKVAISCKEQDVALHHIKTHGALYNLCAKDKRYAELVTDLIEELYPSIPVYAPFNSMISRVAEGRIKVIYEAFADRNYEPDGSLVSRLKNDAIITAKIDVVEHVLNMVLNHKIRTFSGEFISAKIDTICVHGDTPKAVEIVKLLNEELNRNAIKIQTVI
ncbi:5-oxoprolinase subunit PxpA [Leeuwenhoekiella sp. W20_SRS_FM14]|uniref:5-oxoprolinase subunit PxpA n=1 Tax=Leeuwenhoekiella sp. W20_SRS_FM14 TaxID=3240270 RepID=UPI003F95E848